ncbi:MAG: hypothetical protein H6834_17065 [Planctomycetes bacterium]|nr:hypothetical protein [Planctomycetota bacterium]
MISPCFVSLFLSVATLPAFQDPKNDWVHLEGETIAFTPSAARVSPSLHDLTSFVREQLDLTVVIPNEQDGSALRKTPFTFEGTKRIPKAKLYDFFQIILKVEKFACVEVGNTPVRVVQIVRLIGEGVQTVKSSVQYVPIDELDAYADRHGSLIMTIMPLQQIEPAHAQSMLQRFFTSSQLEGFAPLGGPQDFRKALMIIGFGPTVVAIRDLIAAVDHEPAHENVEEAPEPEEKPAALVHLECEVWNIRDAELRAEAEETAPPPEAIAALRAKLRNNGSASREMRYCAATPFQQPTKIADARPGDEDSMRQRTLDLMVERHQAGYQVSFGYTSNTKSTRRPPQTEELNSQTVVTANAWRMLQAGSDDLLVVFLRVRPIE